MGRRAGTGGSNELTVWDQWFQGHRWRLVPRWHHPGDSLLSLNQGKATRSRTTLQISWDLTVRPNWSGSSQEMVEICYCLFWCGVTNVFRYNLRINTEWENDDILGACNQWMVLHMEHMGLCLEGGGTVKASTSIKVRTFWFFHSSSRQALPTFTEESLRWSQEEVSDSGWRQRQDGEG